MLLMQGSVALASASWSLRSTQSPATNTVTQSERHIGTLELGKQEERRLADGEGHYYQIPLSAGQYLRLTLYQRLTSLGEVLSLYAPDGKAIAQTGIVKAGQLNFLRFCEGARWAKSLSIEAPISGTYLLQVGTLAKRGYSQKYRLKIEELREATPRDRTRIIAERLFEQARNLREQMTPDSLRRVIENYSQALELWRTAGDREGEAEALFSIGAVCYYLNDKRRMFDYFEQALKVWRETGDRRAEAATLFLMGVQDDSLDIQKGIEYRLQSLEIVHSIGDRDMEREVLNFIAYDYNLSGEKQKAIIYYDRSLRLVREINDPVEEAVTLRQIGGVYDSLGEKQKSIDYNNQALQISRAVGDHKVEALAINSIGETYFFLGEYQKALDSYLKTLEIGRSAEILYVEAYALFNIGRVYDVLHDKQAALNYYNQSLPIWRATNDKDGAGYTLNYIGGIYNSWGEKEKALQVLGEALQLLHEAGDRYGKSYTQNYIARTYAEMGDRRKALDHYGEALSLNREGGDRRGEGRTLSNIGRVHHSLGDRQKALDHLTQALVINRAINDRTGEANTLYDIARLEGDTGKLGEALSRIDQAVQIVESLRTEVGSLELRTAYLASVHDYYALYIDLLIQMDRHRPGQGLAAMALQASERARARGLLELLNEAHADIRQGVDAALLKREHALQQALNAKADSQMRLLNTKHTDEQASAVKKELDALTTEYNQVKAQIRIKSPRYAALTQPQPLNLKEIQAQVLDADTLLLEYALGDQRSYLWAVTQTSIATYELPKRTEIEAAARRLRELLIARQPARGETDKQYQARVAAADVHYPQEAARLSQTLLGPVAAEMGTKRLLIVADGALQYVSFAALPSPIGRVQSSFVSKKPAAGQKTRRPTTDHRPLIADHEIVTLPSASVLATLRRETEGRKPADKLIAVLADPVFDERDPRIKTNANRPRRPENQQPSSTAITRAVREAGLSDSEGSISRLPFSRQEAESILAIAPAREALRATDFKASRATATSHELSHYRIVHFATHSLLNNEHPELSGIILSLVDDRGQPQDGFLRLHDVYNLNLPAELVVLSSCQTGLGKEIKGEGLVGLMRGFMYAGAARVAASLWKVDDWATAELMKRFYQKMVGQRLRPAAALRAAQLEMWQQKRWQAPYYWAAFVMQGEWK